MVRGGELNPLLRKCGVLSVITIYPDIFAVRGCNPARTYLSFIPREQGRVLPHSQRESFSYQRPTLLGICTPSTPYHTYDLSPPIVKSYCVAPQPVYIYIISYFNIFVKCFLGVSGNFFRFPPTFFQGQLSFRQVQGLR